VRHPPRFISLVRLLLALAATNEAVACQRVAAIATTTTATAAAAAATVAGLYRCDVNAVLSSPHKPSQLPAV